MPIFLKPVACRAECNSITGLATIVQNLTAHRQPNPGFGALTPVESEERHNELTTLRQVTHHGTDKVTAQFDASILSGFKAHLREPLAGVVLMDAVYCS